MRKYLRFTITITMATLVSAKTHLKLDRGCYGTLGYCDDGLACAQCPNDTVTWSSYRNKCMSGKYLIATNSSAQN